MNKYDISSALGSIKSKLISGPKAYRLRGKTLLSGGPQKDNPQKATGAIFSDDKGSEAECETETRIGAGGEEEARVSEATRIPSDENIPILRKEPDSYADQEDEDLVSIGGVIDENEAGGVELVKPEQPSQLEEELQSSRYRAAMVIINSHLDEKRNQAGKFSNVKQRFKETIRKIVVRRGTDGGSASSTMRKAATPAPSARTEVYEWVLPSVDDRILEWINEDHFGVKKIQSDVDLPGKESILPGIQHGPPSVHTGMLNGSHSSPRKSFFQEHANFRVVNLIRKDSSKWSQIVSDNGALSNYDDIPEHFNIKFLNLMCLGEKEIKAIEETKQKNIPKESPTYYLNLPPPIEWSRKPHVGIKINQMLQGILKDRDFRHQVYRGKFPNQIQFSTLFGSITEDVEEYYQPKDEYQSSIELLDPGNLEGNIIAHIDSYKAEREEEEDEDYVSSRQAETYNHHPLVEVTESKDLEFLFEKHNQMNKLRKKMDEAMRDSTLLVGPDQLRRLNQVLDQASFRQPTIGEAQLQNLNTILDQELGRQKGRVRVKSSNPYQPPSSIFKPENRKRRKSLSPRFFSSERASIGTRLNDKSLEVDLNNAEHIQSVVKYVFGFEFKIPDSAIGFALKDL